MRHAYQNMRFWILPVFLVSVSGGFLLGQELEQKKGLSIFFIPERVVGLADDGEMSSGFHVTPQHGLETRGTYANAEDLINYFDLLPLSIRENGLWVVIAPINIYSEKEKDRLEVLKKQCHENHIPLFIGEASTIPEGWQRSD